MKRRPIFAVLTALSLFGCGGGGNSGNSTDATRPTVMYWRTASIPVTITSKEGSLSTGCSADQVDAYRSDGTAVDPTETRTIVAEVISSSASGQSIRLRIKKETLVNGSDKPNNVGLEAVLEGVA